MFFIVGLREINIPAGFDFTSWDDEISFYTRIHKPDEKPKPYNRYLFFTFFFIPIIPLWNTQRLWKIGEDYYKRDIHRWGWILNQLFGIGGVFLVFMLVGLFLSMFGSGGHYRVRMH